MTSERKTAANQRNALHSTGPRTPKGKAVSRLNALKHGLLSGEALVHGERGADLEDFEHRLRVDLAPVGELELLLVDRIVSTAWRLRRSLRLETAFLGQEYQEKRESYMGERDPETAWAAVVDWTGNLEKWGNLNRYEVSLERSLFRALHELQRLQAARGARGGPVPAALDVDLTGT